MAEPLSLGDRQKAYEAKLDLRLNEEQAIVVRVDGHCFSKFTRGFERPFDARLHSVFVSTLLDLMKEYSGCQVGYTQSDEMTLLFPVRRDKADRLRVNLGFAGRVQKLCSVIAGYASARFNHHLSQAIADDPELLARRKVGWAHFDCRIFNVGETESTGNLELGNNLLWRYRDGVKNSKAAFARSHFSDKELHGMNGDAMVTKVKEERGVDWHDLPAAQKFGTLMQRRASTVEPVHVPADPQSFLGLFEATNLEQVPSLPPFEDLDLVSRSRLSIAAEAKQARTEGHRIWKQLQEERRSRKQVQHKSNTVKKKLF